jgi:Toastrack DUF4097
MQALTRGRLAIAAGVGLLAIVSAACDVSLGDGGFSLGSLSGRASDTWTRSYTVTAGGTVEVINTNGIIEVTQGAGPAVEVRAERQAKASTDEAAKAMLARVEMLEKVTPDSVRVETKAPKSFGRSGVLVKYFVTLPKGLRVRASTTNGSINLTGLANDVDASTTNGGIRGQGLEGSILATTTNGGVSLALNGLGTSGLRATTTNGGVEVELPATAKADISVHVTNGGISVENLQVETVGTQNRRTLEGKLNGGGPRVELSTTNGGIRLTGK